MIDASSASAPVRQELNVELQWSYSEKSHCPTDDDMRKWATAALVLPLEKTASQPDATSAAIGEVSIRIVDNTEMQSANLQWRGQDKTTNVLSFPADFPAETGLTYYGDMLICAPVVQLESQQQSKTPEAHWAHMVVHGMLHLQGYDHIDDHEATEMEHREVAVLAALGFPNPYEPGSTSNSVIINNISEVEKN